MYFCNTSNTYKRPYFTTFPKKTRRDLTIARVAEDFDELRGAWKVVKHCLDCLMYLPDRN